MTTAQPEGVTFINAIAGLLGAKITFGRAQPGQEQRMDLPTREQCGNHRDSFPCDCGASVPIECPRYSVDYVTRPTADLGEDGELVEALGDVLDIIAAAQAEFSRTDEHKAYYSKRHEQVQQARDRLILYREAVKHAHTTLVELKIARTLSEGGVGGAATAVSGVVNKLRAVLCRSGK